jgi:hypothetical protein
MQRSIRYGTLFVFSILYFAVAFHLAFAQGAGVGMRPATIEESGEPGTSQEHTVTLSNLSNAEQTFYLFTRDITGVGGGGSPIFADEDAEKTGYELSEWVTTSVEELTIAGGQEASFTIRIDIPENATPGSHFGGVFASIEPPRMRSVGASVGYEVANIISIRVAGDAIESAQIRSFATNNFIYGESKIDFTARIENKGTVLVRPIGPLEIYNMFGSKVATLTFNDTKAGVFPLTTRDFDIVWTGDSPGFGRYQAVLSLVYGDLGRQATISSTATFWILPANIILPALGVLAVLLITVYVAIKLYVRRTLASVGGVRRRVVRRPQNNQMSLLLLITIVMLAVTALFLIILLALFA